MEIVFLILLGKFSKRKMNFKGINDQDEERIFFTLQCFKDPSGSFSYFLLPLSFLTALSLHLFVSFPQWFTVALLHGLHICMAYTLSSSPHYSKVLLYDTHSFQRQEINFIWYDVLSRIFGKIILNCYFEISLGDYKCSSVPCAPGNNFIAFDWLVCFKINICDLLKVNCSLLSTSYPYFNISRTFPLLSPSFTSNSS